ncbi:MAG: hypothetical protein ACO1NO_07645 [Burkholderiaceae bacterium]
MESASGFREVLAPDEELTTPSCECTVTVDPSGMRVELVSPPGPELTLLPGLHGVPVHAEVFAGPVFRVCVSAEACAPEPLAAAAEEDAPEETAHASDARPMRS